MSVKTIVHSPLHRRLIPDSVWRVLGNQHAVQDRLMVDTLRMTTSVKFTISETVRLETEKK